MAQYVTPSYPASMGLLILPSWSTMLILLGIGLCFFTFYSLSTILMPFFIGMIGAYTFNAPVRWLEQHHISRGIGSALVVIGLIILLTLITLVAFPYLEQQLFALASSTPKLVEWLFSTLTPLLEKASQDLGTPGIHDLKNQLTSHFGDLLRWAVHLLTDLLNNSMAIATLLSLVFLTPIVMFYLLKDWPKILMTFEKLLPPLYASQICQHALTLHKTLAAYARGQAMVCLILMGLYATALWLVGLRQGVFVGILTGFLSFIPFVGTLIGFTASIGLSFSQYTEWFPIVLVALVFLSISLLEAHLLIPRFIGQRIGLHPVWVIFALLAGATWFGFVGVLLSLPFSAIAGVACRLTIQYYLKSSFFIQKHANDPAADSQPPSQA